MKIEYRLHFSSKFVGNNLMFIQDVLLLHHFRINALWRLWAPSIIMSDF